MDPKWVDEIKRHCGVLTEQVRADVQQVAVGQQLLRGGLETHRAEVAAEFRGVKALVPLSYAELERRVVTIETELSGLRERMDRLEGHRRVS